MLRTKNNGSIATDYRDYPWNNHGANSISISLERSEIDWVLWFSSDRRLKRCEFGERENLISKMKSIIVEMHYIFGIFEKYVSTSQIFDASFIHFS